MIIAIFHLFVFTTNIVQVYVLHIDATQIIKKQGDWETTI